jgi:hypothetical protein
VIGVVSAMLASHSAVTASAGEAIQK